MIMMDGSVIRHPKKLMILIQTLWEKISNGYARASKNGYYMMRRDDEEIIAEVIYRASYQAKTRSKSCRPIQTKTYATSRLKP